MKKLYLILLLGINLIASEIYIAGGAGYKRPIMDLALVFEKESNIKVNSIFGNMQQVAEQLNHSDKVTLFFGDKEFINKLKLEYDRSVFLGKGILMLVYSKNSNSSTIDDLKTDKIQKIALPDTKKAIYGIAADEFLENSALKQTLESKLTIFQTLPQVSTYLVSGDIDAGFINKTDYLSIKQDVGNAIEIDSKLYNDIDIIAVVLKGKEDINTDKFLEFLSSPKAKEILTKHGL